MFSRFNISVLVFHSMWLLFGYFTLFCWLYLFFIKFGEGVITPRNNSFIIASLLHNSFIKITSFNRKTRLISLRVMKRTCLSAVREMGSSLYFEIPASGSLGLLLHELLNSRSTTTIAYNEQDTTTIHSYSLLFTHKG